MEKSETKVLSVRLSKKLEDEARTLNIDIKGTVEEALKRKIAKAKTERLSKMLKKAVGATGMTNSDWIKAVRESRDER
jgi:post-segregation antitoxin (ccd killing protein)